MCRVKIEQILQCSTRAGKVYQSHRYEQSFLVKRWHGRQLTHVQIALDRCGGGGRGTDARVDAVCLVCRGPRVGRGKGSAACALTAAFDERGCV